MTTLDEQLVKYLADAHSNRAAAAALEAVAVS